MDDAPLSTISDTTWIAQFAQRVSDQQTGTRAFFDAQRQQSATAQARLREQLETVVEQVAASAKRLAAAEEELSRKAEETRQAGELVARERAELDARRAEWEQASRQAAEQQQQQEVWQAELARLQNDLQRRAAELDDRQKAVAEAQSQTDIQRRKIAHGLKAQHAAQWREIQRQRAELERHDNGEVGRLERQLRGIERQRDALQEELESLAERLQKQGLELAEKTRLASQLRGPGRRAWRPSGGAAEPRIGQNAPDRLDRSARGRTAARSGIGFQVEVLRRRHEELLPELETPAAVAPITQPQLEIARSAEEGLRAELAAASSRRTGCPPSWNRSMAAAGSSRPPRQSCLATSTSRHRRRAGWPGQALDEAARATPGGRALAAGDRACDSDMRAAMKWPSTSLDAQEEERTAREGPQGARGPPARRPRAPAHSTGRLKSCGLRRFGERHRRR